MIIVHGLCTRHLKKEQIDALPFGSKMMCFITRGNVVFPCLLSMISSYLNTPSKFSERLFRPPSTIATIHSIPTSEFPLNLSISRYRIFHDTPIPPSQSPSDSAAIFALYSRRCSPSSKKAVVSNFLNDYKLNSIKHKSINI